MRLKPYEGILVGAAVEGVWVGAAVLCGGIAAATGLPISAALLPLAEREGARGCGGCASAATAAVREDTGAG